MPLILSIETATPTCSVALHQGGNLLAYSQLFANRSHSDHLMSLVKGLLENSSHDPKSLTAVAVSGGPGSYTGLRIGTAVAKGLCYALSIPLISVGTLEAMAHGMRTFIDKETLLVPVMDARRTAVYTLIADQSGAVRQPPHVALLDNKVYRDGLPEQSLWLFGDGVSKAKLFLLQHKNIRFIDGVIPTAIEIGCLAFLKFQEANWENIASYKPWYLSQFQE